MSQTIEVPDTVYTQLTEAAGAEGLSPAEWIIRRLPAFAAPPGQPVPWTRFAPEFLEVATRMAAEKGQTLQHFITDWWSIQGPRSPQPMTQPERESYHQQHCGILSSGNLHSADNDGIDADLAREYEGWYV